MRLAIGKILLAFFCIASLWAMPAAGRPEPTRAACGGPCITHADCRTIPAFCSRCVNRRCLHL